jgi:predicted nucleic acid-binding protein
VRYWDASALVALCVTEADTPAVRRLAAGGIVTWSVSAVEIASAIERRGREGSLSDDDRAAARAALAELAAAWTEIAALGPIRERALRLVATHPLRAADAMQLGAALVAVSDRRSATTSSAQTAGSARPRGARDSGSCPGRESRRQPAQPCARAVRGR